MNNTASSSSETALSTAPAAKTREKILFEIQPLLLPTILNMETLTILGFTFVIVIAGVIFHFGLSEFLIIGVLYLLIAYPSFRDIFRAGSTTYVLTNQRLVIFGVSLKSKEHSIPLDQIVDVKVKSSGLQRFYGAGNIIVNLKSLRKPIRMYGLRECKRRAEQIRQAAKKYQQDAA